MEHTNEENNDRNLTLRIWTKISDETGIRVEMVGHIHHSITRKRKNEIHIDSRNATHFIIQDLIDNDNGSIQEILEYNGIKSSEDFGTVVKRLCEEGVIIKEENDNYEDFKGHFTTISIDDFIKHNNLKKERNWFTTISYSLYVIGFVIVLSSYVDIIPNEIGWLGWGLGMLGWLLLSYKSQITVRLSKVLNMNKI
ncbi:MAG: hypothetical protein J7604_23930 [Sporocytophaga sp.]|uniref:hypothetical protein n=1 Tax=Sporocytophaga sp. TaxID=2231183 RepID=UPI001B0B4986|nr:hypothetical protein [Sporocytophaga sp.]MBO9703285.1 hypothetical protein [Sporocytophaga sp.]